jgi:DNA-binding CsgD family transcriptional regulator
MNAGFDDRNGWSQPDHRPRLTTMDRDTVLPDRLLRRMLDVLDEARRDDTDEAPPRCIVRSLAELVPGLVCEFLEVDLINRRVLNGQTSYVDPAYQAAIGLFDPGIHWRLRYQQPICHHRDTTGSLDVAMLSDFISLRQWHARELYQATDYKVSHIDHIMGLPLPAAPGRHRGYRFEREAGTAFSETERMMLTLLQPHLHQIHQNAARRQRHSVQLTERQVDVLRCVALGMSNDQIARRLIIAPGTVTKHLDNVYGRLGVTSRTAAVARVFHDPDTEPTSVAP